MCGDIEYSWPKNLSTVGQLRVLSVTGLSMSLTIKEYRLGFVCWFGFFFQCVHCICNCVQWWHLHQKLLDKLLQYDNFASSIRLMQTFFFFF